MSSSNEHGARANDFINKLRRLCGEAAIMLEDAKFHDVKVDEYTLRLLHLYGDDRIEYESKFPQTKAEEEAYFKYLDSTKIPKCCVCGKNGEYREDFNAAYCHDCFIDFLKGK